MTIWKKVNTPNLIHAHTVLHYYRKFMKTETQNGKKTKSVSGQQINKDGE